MGRRRRERLLKEAAFCERLEAGFGAFEEAESGPADHEREDFDRSRPERGWRQRRRYHEFWESIPDRE